MLLIALVIALPGCSKNTPTKIPPGVTFEIYEIAAAHSADTKELPAPDSSGSLHLRPKPILTTEDVATVSHAVVEQVRDDGTPSERTGHALNVKLTSAGAAKMEAATVNAQGGSLAVVVNHQVIAIPRVFSPIKDSFQISGGDAKFVAAVGSLVKPELP
jgi:preprotein translocase subunit SecD